MNVNELIKKYELQILEQNGKRGVHACKNPTDTDKRDIISNMEAILVELDRRESEKIMLTKSVRKRSTLLKGYRKSGTLLMRSIATNLNLTGCGNPANLYIRQNPKLTLQP